MKNLRYFSPSSFALYERDREEFYLHYLTENPPPRLSQTLPMSVGSAFDARIKCYLYNELFGNEGPNNEFNCEKIFEAQVEPQCRDFAGPAGEYIFEQYKKCGALADFMQDLEMCCSDPRLEFKVENRVAHETNQSGIVLLGKPDFYYRNKANCPVIRDWKVNGFCSNSFTSPAPQYVKLRPGNTIHKNCMPMMVDGLIINVGATLEQINTDWAQQLAIYGWVLGEPVGSGFIVGIDQIVAGKNTGDNKPLIRVATHNYKIGADFQHDLFKRLSEAWEIVHSNHYFRDMTLKQSQERCGMLDMQYKAFADIESDNKKWYCEIMRQHRNY